MLINIIAGIVFYLDIVDFIAFTIFINTFAIIVEAIVVFKKLCIIIIFVLYIKESFVIDLIVIIILFKIIFIVFGFNFYIVVSMKIWYSLR